MNWTANIIKEGKDESGHLTVVVEYHNSVTNETYDLSYQGILSDADLKGRISAQIANYDKTALYTPPLGVVDVTPLIPKDPTLIAQEKAFSENLLKLRRYQAAVKFGWVAANDKGYTDLQAQLIADWKIEFLEILPMIVL